MKTLRDSALLASILLVAVACGDGPQAGVDGQTHWLGECHESVECRAGLTCLCGVCTRACESTSECSGLGANATCAEPSAVALDCRDHEPSGGLCVAECR